MFITFPKTEFWIFTRGRFFVKLVVNDSCILLLLHELKIVERKKKIKNQNFALYPIKTILYNLQLMILSNLHLQDLFAIQMSY